MALRPETRHPSYAHGREDFSKYNPEQQDAILAEMQSTARMDWKTAATIAERQKAVTAFAHAAQARESLAETISARAAYKERQRYQPF